MNRNRTDSDGAPQERLATAFQAAFQAGRDAAANGAAELSGEEIEALKAAIDNVLPEREAGK